MKSYQEIITDILNAGFIEWDYDVFQIFRYLLIEQQKWIPATGPSSSGVWRSMRDWVAENIKHEYIVEDHEYVFSNEEDAIAFILKWSSV